MTQLKFPRYHFDWSKCASVRVQEGHTPTFHRFNDESRKAAAAAPSGFYKTHDFQEKLHAFHFPQSVQLIMPHTFKKPVPALCITVHMLFQCHVN